MQDALSAAAIQVAGLAVHLVDRCTSTNTLLLAGEYEPPCLLAAEEQTAGRGRRGRRWYSARGASATFSLAYVSARALRDLGGLSLVAGVAAAHALRTLGASTVRLKWPNDLVVGEAKLGGILVETRAAANGPGGTLVVIGIGINCKETDAVAERVRRNVTSLERLHVAASRNQLIGAIAERLVAGLARFEAAGLEPTRAEWEALDGLAGKPLRVRLADGRVVSGVASGLAHDGALRLRTARGMRNVHSGRVVAARLL